MSLESTTKAVQQLTSLLGAINPLVAAGVSVFEAVRAIAKRRGSSDAEAEALARQFIRDVDRMDLIADRLIDKGEARLKELDARPFDRDRDPGDEARGNAGSGFHDVGGYVHGREDG